MSEHDFQERREGPPDRRNEWLEAQLCAAMAKAMRDVLTDPLVIEAMGAVAITIIQRQAAERTGNFLLSTLRALFTRWIVIGMLLLALGQLIGIPAALRAIAPAITKGHQ